MTDLLTAPCQNVVTDGPPAEGCGDQPAATLKVGCMHEHVSEMRICYGCAAEVQMEPGPWTCPKCFSDATVVITWDSGETMIVGEVAKDG